MRQALDAERLREFMRALGKAARTPATVYLTGGSTAVLLGWRAATIDVDIEIMPDSDELLRAIPALKESLRVNVELSSPAHFIPAPPGWRERCPWICREGALDFRHYDLYGQALAKIQRGHTRDLLDVQEMLARGLVERGRLREVFEAIALELYRYPAIDPASFRGAVERAMHAS